MNSILSLVIPIVISGLAMATHPLHPAHDIGEAEELLEQQHYDATFRTLCLSPNRSAIVQQSEQCITDPTIKSVMVTCRKRVYDTEDVNAATETFCNLDNSTREEYKERFENCTGEGGLNAKILSDEYDRNCGFCKTRDVLARVDSCLQEGIVKNIWLDCREATSGTRDPNEATDRFCDLSTEEKTTHDDAFYACLSAAQITRELWNEASVDCRKQYKPAN